VVKITWIFPVISAGNIPFLSERSIILDYSWVRSSIENMRDALNAAFTNIIQLLGNNELLEDIAENPQLSTLTDAVQGTAITLCTLFFLIDFFSKTLHLQWVTWENVLMLFLKLVVAKVCVDHAAEILDMIFTGFNSISANIVSEFEIIPTSNPIEMTQYFWLSEDEAKKLYPTGTYNCYPVNVGFLDFTPLWIMMKVDIMSILMVILLVISTVIVIGRFFELTVYTIIAPVPLATLACEGLQDVGKGFLKSYTAVCIQAIVLVVMFSSFSVLHEFMATSPMMNGIVGWKGLIEIFTLALGVMQSGSWAKKICGAM